jgi:hypothetical protein
MTPKEKAKELFDKMMYEIMYNCQPTLSEMVAKQCALIAVDEILNSRPIITDNQVDYQLYWRQVKNEIIGGEE